jgi:hypothetical protein
MHYRATSLHVINNIVNLTWIWRLTSNVIENNCTYTNLGAAMQWVFSYNIMTYITCDWLNLSILYFYIIFFILYFLYYILLFLYYKNILYFYFYFYFLFLSLYFIFYIFFNTKLSTMAPACGEFSNNWTYERSLTLGVLNRLQHPLE